MVKYTSKIIFFGILISLNSLEGMSQILKEKSGLNLKNNQFTINVKPETFTLSITPTAKEKNFISFGHEQYEVKNLKSNNKGISWKIPEKNITVNLEIVENFLDVEISTGDEGEFLWPDISGGMHEAFTIPFHQGKYIPAKDYKWIEHMVPKTFSGAQDLSMQFFGVNYENYALVYVIKNMYNNEIKFDKNPSGNLSLKFHHEFPRTVKNKSYGFRIYLSKNTPTAIAKIYKEYVEEQGTFITLEEKAEKNSNIRKLFGAPHMYLWGSEFFIGKNITNWKLLKTKFVNEVSASENNPSKHLMKLFNWPDAVSGKEFIKAFDTFKKTKYLSKHQNRLFTKAVNEVMLYRDFYNHKAWNDITLTKVAIELLKKGIKELNNSDLYQLNKELLWSVYGEFMEPVSEWGNGLSNYLLNEFQSAGIKKGWIGVNDWIPAEIHPDFINRTNDLGYLIGPYDSYHSIHKPGNERWITAKFKDTSLFYNATISRFDGTKKTGFNKVGRKLNPSLSMPSVRDRLNGIMNEGLKINSWFIDVDATGEFHDDYTPERMTTQRADMNARLERMAWIRDAHNMVVGSEVGNDFSSTTIAFAHGMTTPVIEWSDPDLRKNKNSKYYVGSYFAIDGGVPSKFSLQVPLKEKHRYIYFDNRFNIPLFQLVYNNSVITSHHWEWGTLKVPLEIKDQNLKEILYNVPPLYHLDIAEWKKHKEAIISHYNVFSKVHENAIQMEMTNFVWLDNSHLIQQTTYGDNNIRITANFSLDSYMYKGNEISSKSLLIEYPKKQSTLRYAPN